MVTVYTSATIKRIASPLTATYECEGLRLFVIRAGIKCYEAEITNE